MRTLYIDCGMGAAGDMLTAALLEAACQTGGENGKLTAEEFVRKFREIGIPGVEMQVEKTQKCGITGTHVHILVNGVEEGAAEAGRGHEHDEHDHDHHHEHEHHHEHRSMKEIEALVNDLRISEEIRQDVLAVYTLIAEAEASVHGTTPGEVHFHEVGAMDAVADITAVCMLIREIAPDEIVASPVATGYGSVHCAHGILPVPAPATALLLRGIPSYAGEEEGELCTPTGAALIRHFADRYTQMPLMRTEAVGYGIGTKDFKKANCLRVFVGETEAPSAGARPQVAELSCNIDDMTGEEIGFAAERLFEAGALDVYTVPVFMKKNRPGILLRVMCTPEKKEDLVRAIFRYTSTIGIRENVMERYVLHRDEVTEETGEGTFRKKEVIGHGVSRSKWEYEDLAKLARERDCSLREAAELLRKKGE